MKIYQNIWDAAKAEQKSIVLNVYSRKMGK